MPTVYLPTRTNSVPATSGPSVVTVPMSQSRPNPRTDSKAARHLVVEAVDAAAQVLADPAVARCWNDPSALAGMTVGALAAHLVRAAGATIAYLDRTDPAQRPTAELLTPVTYFHAAIASPIHEQIKTVSAQEAAAGPDDIAAKGRNLVVALRDRLEREPPDRLVAALGGRMLRLDDFCRTRMIEILLHTDDLVASVGLERPPTDPAGPELVLEILIGIARDRHGDWALLHALARSERAKEGVFPVF